MLKLFHERIPYMTDEYIVHIITMVTDLTWPQSVAMTLTACTLHEVNTVITV